MDLDPRVMSFWSTSPKMEVTALRRSTDQSSRRVSPHDEQYGPLEIIILYGEELVGPV